MDLNYYQPDEKINWLELPTQYAFTMKRQEKYRWWKPIVAFFLGLVFFLIFVMVLTAPLIFASPLGDLSTINSAMESLSDPSNPLIFAYGLLSVALMLPAFGIASKIMGLGGVRGLSSVEGKLRWDRIRAFAPWTVLVIVVWTVVTTGFDAVVGGTDLGAMRFLPASILIVLICAPIQSAAEEYAFRGFGLQTLSSWIPVVAVPILLQALFFGSQHTQYNILGMLSVTVMGLTAAYLTCKTGGIEAGICIHASNNTIGMLLTCFFASAETGYDVTVAACACDLVLQIAFCAIVMWVAKRKGFVLKK